MAHKKQQSKASAESAHKRLSRAHIRSRRQIKQVHKNELRTGRKKVSSGFRIFRDSLSLVRQHWKLFLGVIIIYGAMSLVLVGGFGSNINATELKQTYSEDLGSAGATVALFGTLIGSVGGAPSEVGGAYQSIIAIVISLAVIWGLRQMMAVEKVLLRDLFYKGMYPLVPFVLVLLVFCLQLIPALIGSFVFSSVFQDGLAVSVWENLLWGSIIALLFWFSLYMVTSSSFAMYIVTLPDMKPMTALRTARKLVKYRRMLLLRKMLFLPLALLIIGAVIFLPLITFIPAVVVVAFALMGMFALVFAHIYMYSLYRELL